MPLRTDLHRVTDVPDDHEDAAEAERGIGRSGEMLAALLLYALAVIGAAVASAYWPEHWGQLLSQLLSR